MTVLMVFGLMPAGVNLKDVKADEGTATVYFNLNAVTLTDGKFTIDTTTLIGDVPAIATLGKTMTVQTAEGVTDEDGNELTRKL